jgi:tRNA (cmo5U34)-methyltransferase
MLQPQDPKPTLVSAKDQLFEQTNHPKPFEFNAAVAEVFDDMVSRSVPLYLEMHELLVEWVRRYYQKGTFVLDYGCSTGTAMELLAKALPEVDSFVGVDSSKPMLDQARQKTAEQPKIKFECNEMDPKQASGASVVLMNYTLQFIPVHQRLEFLQAVCRNMSAGGLFFMSEKMVSANSKMQDLSTQVYERFKNAQGYSLDEIARKKEALNNVLIPLRMDETYSMLGEAGFCSIQPILMWNNFATFVCEKP